MYPKIRSFTPKLVQAVCVVLLLIIVFAQPAFGVGPVDAPPDRPPLPKPDNGSSGDGDDGSDVVALSCAGVRGVVVNWGYQNEPGVTLQLEGNAYNLSQVSASDGRYDFRGLGQGYAILKPLLIGGQKDLKIHTDDVALSLRCGFDDILNVGIYSGGDRPQPPAYLSLAVDETSAEPGDVFDLIIKARNTLPTSISNVIITDLFPSFIKVKGVEVTQGSPEVLDDRMLSIYIGNMDSGAEVTATVALEVIAATSSGKTAVNRTTLLYAESMADQAVSTFTVGEKVAIETGYEPALIAMAVTKGSNETTEEPSVPSATEMEAATEPDAGTPEEVVSAFSVEEAVTKEPVATEASVTIFSLKETPVAPAAVALVEEITRTSDISPALSLTETISVNGRLPVTGGGIDWVSLPLLGMGLAIIALLAKALRSKTI